MNTLKILAGILILTGAVAQAQVNGMTTNPANSQPGTTIPLNNGTTQALPLNGAGRLTTAPPMQPPTANNLNQSTTGGAVVARPTATP